MAVRKTSASKNAPGPEAETSGSPGATARSGFPIVAIGASAGGLEAFEAFFRKVPPNPEMAFVLVAHLDPGHVSILSDILQRSTSMPVVEAEDQMRVDANRVYVIPPNRDMTIFHGVLQLSLPEQPRGHRLPIDAFQRSLAEDHGGRSVGIILSGTGTDGTQGLRAILGAGGVSFVQDPSTAKYDGMPNSAIRAGYATQVLAVEEIPAALLGNVRSTTALTAARPKPDTVNAMQRILMLLRSGTGHDFSHYKKSTIGRRIDRRMSQQNIDDLQIYARYLKEHPEELQVLFKELLINVTCFFRDPEAFVTLEKEILPPLLADRPEGQVLRVWVPGCATGEEAYSIAIVLREWMEEQRQEFRVQIYSTDLDEDAIFQARSGSFHPNIAQDVDPERLRRFFVKNDSGYQVKKEIREMVIFAVQNVIQDPPFTRLDLISCRNLMIYLEPELQNVLIPSFHYALKCDGVLFLSPSESIGSHSELFTPLHRKWKFYRANSSANSKRTVLSSGLHWAGEPKSADAPDESVKRTKSTNFAELARRVLVQSYAPASVLTDMLGNILYVHGETGKFLRPAPGNASLNIVDMSREGLQPELRSAIQNSERHRTAIFERELTVKTNGESQQVQLSIRPVIGRNPHEHLLLLSFRELGHATMSVEARNHRSEARVADGRFEEMERELGHTRESLQAIIEEQQASNEELQSANEEMQSTNEELQSTNEEMETSKEELQSVNEELVTVNAELQGKIEQLAEIQNDMKNLLDNMNVGTIFLDRNFIIRRFTRDASRAFRLIATDVGRPLADITSNVEMDDMLSEAQLVLDSLVPREREVRGSGGSWYLVRIQPYRTLENVIEGVVLTFTDIAKRVAAEISVNDARDLAEAIVDTVRSPLIVLDGRMKVISANRPFYSEFRITSEQVVGRLMHDVGDGQWNLPKLRELLQNVLPLNQSFEDYSVEHDFPGVGRKTLLLNARRIVQKKDAGELILLAIEVRPQGRDEVGASIEPQGGGSRAGDAWSDPAAGQGEIAGGGGADREEAGA